MRNKSFAVFILSHGRANNVITIKTLREIGYTGKIYIIIDNEDSQENEYKKIKDVEDIIVFNKKEEMRYTDTADNFKDHRLVVYARNKCHSIAKDLGLEYFLELDDDYTGFGIRYDNDGKLSRKKITKANKLFDAFIDFLEKSNALTVAFAQGGDYIGGIGSKVWQDQLSRKAMNCFFCKTDRPFKFSGSTNEDVNAYITYGNKGKLMFTVADICMDQLQTQSNPGGLTDIYLDNGTYVKSFYSVIHQPQCVKISSMGNKFRRIHHKILWDKCTPKILNEKWKKI